MKRLLLAATLLLLANTLFAQKFNLAEMTKMISMNWDEFDTYVITKGYQYFDNDDNELAIRRRYRQISKEYAAGHECHRVISRMQAKSSEGHPAISYTTYFKQDYAAIKDQLKTSGFKYFRSVTHPEHDKNDVWLQYTKGQLLLSLVSGKAKTADGQTTDIPEYEISITKLDEGEEPY